MSRLLHTMVAMLVLYLPVGPSLQCLAADRKQDAGIYVIGSLHELHATTPGFDYADLKRVIEATAPQVAVLETRPDELSGRTDTPGRPEYPRIMWPYLAANPSIKVTPIEPGGALFEAWVAQASADAKRFEEQNSTSNAYWNSYQQSLKSVLQLHWRAPADAHDQVTADLARSWYLIHYSLAGEAARKGQERWDAYMLERAVRAARAHPKERLLVLVSYRNRHRFEEALRAAQPARIVNIKDWLRASRSPAAR